MIKVVRYVTGSQMPRSRLVIWFHSGRRAMFL